MKTVFNSQLSIGANYPTKTGRLKQVGEIGEQTPIRVALVGDSTLDNGFWVQQGLPYSQKTATVTHQAAMALAKAETNHPYLVANFAVDGATTADLGRDCWLNKVLPADADHPWLSVNQLRQVEDWQPNVVVMSVAGNNYREALQGALIESLGYQNILSRTTPDDAKHYIATTFAQVKKNLLAEYKAIIDDLIEHNPSMSRLVLMSQYYPELTQFTGYMIYTGFSHVARSEGQTRSAFEAMENTMNELYREIQTYVSSKDKQVVFVDVTSSLNPLGGNHTMQIEPNHNGAKELGKLIAEAVSMPERDHQWVLTNVGDTIEKKRLTDDLVNNYTVKRVEQFIQESRYRHVGLFFAPSSSMSQRFESAYHLLVGKQFDAQYTGLFAFGLLDASVVTVLAQYLWRAALNDDNSKAARITAAVVAAPILIIEHIVALALLLALSLPIVGMHYLAKQFEHQDPAPTLAPATNA
ncbi:SGNH/GDSL hydrolase family protein [Legionella sp. W05-934-2]|jgi:hypothetical protein|uniref:SGNH/GDSL hydrolase family protein n=1 Tax=Legionella sp. W05-934-2 TaxID=1198649 RepID=UPI003461ACB9